ncbi:hypothetical protein OKW30_006087 [Paraburkholderia sp. Clong3]|uniref:TniQ family protein n=1 Tax=Paraburkholderia sp. Clong3 TaxID=2991061 RepID=UPI003D1B6082
MAVYLDEQLDDEPLFGIIARYIDTTPAVTVKRIIPFLYGKRWIYASNMGRNIDHLASVTGACWGLAPEKIIYRMTLFPYFSSMLEKNQASDLLEQMIISKSRGGGRTVYGPNAGMVELRYCRSCLLEDRERGEPMHWRRTHQLPGVIICLRHREFLWFHRLNRMPFRLGYLTPDVAQKFGVKRIVTDVMQIREEAALEYAQASQDLLNGSKSLDRGPLILEFSRFLRQQSRYFAGDKFNECVMQLIENCFGKDYLECARIGRFENYFRSGKFHKVHVAKLVLITSLRRMIERNPELLRDDGFKPIYGGVSSDAIKCGPLFRPRPSVVCPSLVAPHGAGHIVEKTAWNERALRCVCDCGMTFICPELDVGIGPPRVTRWGAVYCQEVKKLKSLGHSWKYIAEKLGLPKATVFKMLAT